MSPDEVARFRSGDPDLFRRLVDTHSPRLLALARGFAPDVDGAHDLVQETWVRAYGGRRTYRGGAFGAWLVTVCRNVCVSHVRARRPGREEADPERLVDRSGNRPDDDAARAELRHDISRALFELPERQREVVVHRMMEGRSTRDTALLMGCAVGTVKATLHQALARLAEPLARHGIAPAGTRPDMEPKRREAR